jgi:phenylalanyl-tRNA synthetase beta chain
MKVSLNWVKEFTDVNLPIDDLLEKIGAQLGAVEEVVNLGERYRGIVIAKVVSCQKHPDADKLSLCKIDDGGEVKDVPRDENGHVQVVCGAPNVSQGMLVAWLPPGTTVPNTYGKQPFVLEAREIRGQLSNGMLASPKELAIGDNHDGILELDSDFVPGADFATSYKLDDYIIDIENKMFTHRPDLFGQLGVAREVAGIIGQQFTSPDWYTTFTGNSRPANTSLPLEVKNELPDAVPRFTAVAISNVEIKPSSIWIQSFLARVGVRPINNAVDMTNYMMMLTGQPLHAYDYDKVKAQDPGADKAALVIRNPRGNEKLTLLNGKTITPRQDDIMIASDTKLIGLGGVMGGADTEVDEHTKNIILECANFNMYAIRRTSMAHGIFSDAVTRFTKGQSPLQNDRVITESARRLIDNGPAEFASQLIDNNHLNEAVMKRDSLYPPVKVAVEFINARLGLKLTADEMKKLLENVEFKGEINGDELTVMAPFWRTDIELREDVVEEVGRLYGFDKLPLELPRRDLTPTAKDPLLELKAMVRERLSRAGANEALTYSFVHGDLLDKVGQDKAKAFEVSNALSPDLQYYRMSLMPSLLEKVHPNIKAGYDEFALFELGKTHSLDQLEDDGLPGEFEFTALVVTANDKLKKPGAPYYQARKYLDYLAGAELTFKPISEAMSHYPVIQPYNPERSALVSVKDGDFLGIIGEFKPGVARSLKLPKYTAGFEIDTTVLQPLLKAGPYYSPLFRFPSVKQDITLKAPADLSYAAVYDFVSKELAANAPDETHVRLELIDIYQKDDDPEHKQFTFRVTITADNRTLTDAEVNKTLDNVAAATKTKLGAERV